MRNKIIFSVFIVVALAMVPGIYLLENATAAVRNPFVSQLPLPQEPQEGSQKGALKVQGKEQPVPAPIILAEKDLPSLKVTGLVWNSKRPQAIINGQVVSAGETIGDVKIVNIRPDGVDVLFQDKIITITP